MLLEMGVIAKFVAKWPEEMGVATQLERSVESVLRRDLKLEIHEFSFFFVLIFSWQPEKTRRRNSIGKEA